MCKLANVQISKLANVKISKLANVKTLRLILLMWWLVLNTITASKCETEAIM